MTVNEVPVGLRTNANWRRLWFGQAVSLVGDFVFNTTVVLWVATVIAGGRTWSAAAVSGVLIAAAVPILLIGPIAGVYVDRWDRRRTMMAADLIRAAFIAVLLIVPSFGTGWPIWLQLSVVYGMVALTSGTAQFFNPARFAVIATTVAPDDRARAFGLLSASASTAAVIGPPLAAPLLFGTGVQWALLVNIASFLVSYLAVRAIRLPQQDSTTVSRAAGFLAELKEGLGFFIRNRALVVIAAAVCVYMFGVGAINVLDVFFVTDNLRSDAGWLGPLSAAFGVGSIFGALIAGRITGLLGETRVFTLGLAATGLVVLVYSRMTDLTTAIVLLAIAGIPLAMVNAVIGPLVLRVTPQHLLGRINSVLNPLVYLASIVSMALAGFLASTVLRDMRAEVAGLTFTRIDTVFAIGAVLMVIAGLAAVGPLTRQASEPSTSDSHTTAEAVP